MEVIWSVEARWQLDAIVMCIAQDNPDAALNLDNLLIAAAESLRFLPQKGRLGRVAGTRELVVHANYILVYVEDGLTINIVAVLHSARQYPLE